MTHLRLCLVTVRNTGLRRGREIVQVYASRPDSAIERPPKWLAAFAAVDAGPGRDGHRSIPSRARLPALDRGGWAIEPGPFVLTAGPSSASLPLTALVQLP